MAISTIDGVESVRVVRASGNLKVKGSERPTVEIDSGVAPRVTITAGVAEVSLRDNATLSVPAGVSVELEDVGGNLDVSDLSAPLTLTRVRGNFSARRVGAVSMRDTVSGNVTVKEAGAIDGMKVRGALTVEAASSITFSHVSGGLECTGIEGEVAVEKIAGSARLHGLRAPFIARVIGGHLELEDAAHAEAGVVGGKVRATNLSGGLQIGKIGGKLTVDAVAGEVAAGFVGGSARLAHVGGALNLEDVGGAVYMEGPFPGDKAWIVRSRGRINVEVDASSSIELDASAGWGQIRSYGIDAAKLEWVGRNHVHGPIGPDPANGARTKIAVETRSADVIVASADARERDFSGRGYRSRAGAAFAEPFEDFANDLGAEVPAFVRSVLDAASEFVSDTGGLSTGFVRDVTRDVKRSVGEGLREVERAIGDIEESVPGDIGEKLSKLGKEVSDLVSQAMRGSSREARNEMRERVREAAREMRDRIKDAARDVRERRESRKETGTDAASQPGTQTDADKSAPSSSAAEKFRPGGTVRLNRDEAIMEILAAVKDGRLEPDEADDLINAWMEVSRTEDARR